MAQSGFFATPSLSLAEVYDDNLFFTPSQREEDFISRLSPAIEAGYRSAALTLLGRYTLDAESYAQHSELDTTRARTQAAMDFRYQPTRLLTLSADLNDTKTQMPGELNLETGLQLGRARAERLSIAPAAAYRFGPLTAGTAAYTFTRDKLEGGMGADTHTAALSLDRRISQRDTMSLAYTFRQFLFDGQDTTTAHVVTLGGTRAITPQTTVSLVGGPRFSEGSIDPEVSASIRHVRKRGELSLNYARSQSTVIGQAGAVATETFGATAAYLLGPSWEIQAAPSFLSSRRGALQADVYRMNLATSYRITKSLSLNGSYQFNSQRGSLDIASGEEITRRNVVLLSIVVASPSRTDSALQPKELAPPPQTEAWP
jgi:hypothetical protein